MKQFNDMEHSLQFNFHRGVAECFTIKLFFQELLVLLVLTTISYYWKGTRPFLETLLDFWI